MTNTTAAAVARLATRGNIYPLHRPKAWRDCRYVQAAVSCRDLSRPPSYVVALMLVATCPAMAVASPRSDPTVGVTVFTGAATAHPAGISINPATIGLGNGTTAYLGATATLDQVGANTPANNGDQGGDVSVISASPGLDVSINSHVGENLAIGFRAASGPAETFFAPRDNSMRFASLGGRQRDYQFTLAGAYRIGQRTYIGVSGALGYTDFRWKFSRDIALDDASLMCGATPCGIGNPLAAQDYDLKLDSKILESSVFSLGVIVKITPTSFIGAAYHPPPGFGIVSSLAGELRLKQPSLSGGEVIKGSAELSTSLPASIDAEFRSAINPQLEAHIGGRWQDLSRLAAFDIRPYGAAFASTTVPQWLQRPRGFDDAVALWAGIEEIDRGAPLRFGGRLGFETSAIAPTRTTVTTIAGPTLSAQLGGQWRVAPGWSLAAHYGFTYFLPRTVTAESSAYQPADAWACTAADYDYTLAACERTRQGYTQFAAEGTYTRLQHALRVGLQYDY